MNSIRPRVVELYANWPIRNEHAKPIGIAVGIAVRNHYEKTPTLSFCLFKLAVERLAGPRLITLKIYKPQDG